MTIFSIEWISVAVITWLAVISPGPDFAMVSKLSLSQGRKAGVLCALGIGTGISIHLTYTLFGFGILLSKQVWLLEMIRLIGASYLIWLGVSSFWPDVKHWLNRSKPAASDNAATKLEMGLQVKQRPFASGFICNAFNPKTMLFIVALYSQVIASDTSLLAQLGYGLHIAAAHIIWFTIVACLLTTNVLQKRIAKAKRWLERVCGSVMLIFGVKLIG